MAITVSTSEFKSLVGGKFTPHALMQGRKLLIYVAKVTVGASDNYATNGFSADLLSNGAKTFLWVVPIQNDANVIARYDETNKKVLCFGQEPTSTSSGVVALTQLAASSTIINSKVFEFLVFAQK